MIGVTYEKYGRLKRSSLATDWLTFQISNIFNVVFGFRLMFYLCSHHRVNGIKWKQLIELDHTLYVVCFVESCCARRARLTPSLRMHYYGIWIVTTSWGQMVVRLLVVVMSIIVWTGPLVLRLHFVKKFKVFARSNNVSWDENKIESKVSFFSFIIIVSFAHAFGKKTLNWETNRTHKY